MLEVLGAPARACDGLSRRRLLTAGAAALFGVPLAARAAASSRPRAKAVILLDLYGGPSHIDTFDPKPDAPPEVRGPFGTIPTSLPGVRVCEHLPKLASRLDKLCLIRTVSHGYNSHNPYAVMTGYTGGQDQVDYFAKPTNHPSMGSVCQYLGLMKRRDLPGYVVLPAYPGYSQGLRRAGPYGGYLGSAYDPMFSTCNPTWDKPNVGEGDFYSDKLVAMGEPTLPSAGAGMTLDALDRRRTLLGQLDACAKRADRIPEGRGLTRRQRDAFDLLLSNKAREAFALDREPERVRDAYGRDLFGQSVLLARRLVEHGVTFVTIHTEARGNGHWDTHNNNFNMLRNVLLPFLDRAVSVLLDDLAARGLLDSTLVVVNGDMGRTPRVNKAAGRDHWPQCGFALLAGGGTKAGMVYGTSDKTAAFPTSDPVSPGDLVSTVYHVLGLDPHAMVPDQTGRPIAVGHGGGVLTRVLA